MVYRWYAVATRLILLGWCILTSIYSLLAFIPFTYHEVIEAPLLGWQHPFVAWYPIAFAAVVLIAATGLIAEFRARQTRILSIAFVVIYAATAVALVDTNLIAALTLSSRSLLISIAALTPPLWLAAIDLVARGGLLRGRIVSGENDSRLFLAAVCGAAFVTAVYATLRLRSATMSTEAAIASVVISLLAHLLLFMTIFLVLSIARTLSRPSRNSRGVEFLLVVALAAVALGVVLAVIVFTPIAFTGARSRYFAAFLAAVVSISLATTGLRATEEHAPATGFDLATAWFPANSTTTILSRCAAFVVLVGISAVLAVESSSLDWDFLLQKLAALTVAVLAFLTFYGMLRSWKSERQLALLGMSIAVLALWLPLNRSEIRAMAVSRGTTLTRVTEQEANLNASFRLIYQTITPKPAEDQMSLYRFLQKSTNIGRDIKVSPVNVNIGPASASTAQKPNVFVFVIDSLRRDYVGVYNRKVTFTPSIDQLARDSVVFERAFTHYGGTGLSEPAIWTGALMLHKQYVTPFYPMNALQKLLEAEHYRMFIVDDPILRVATRPSPSIVPIDVESPTYDFCLAINDLKKKIDATPAGQPVFAYVQPQNIHIAAINREGAKPIDNANYDGFHAPYASRLRRIDRCIGEFVAYLKQKGLYDSSMIIVTSDHGDSLGEDGRWGHAYTIYPEVLRIPLVVHMPAAWKERFTADHSQLAFSTDITPTLLYFFGYRDRVSEPFAGNSLFHEVGTSVRTRRPAQLIASSYGPVYGMLDDDGKTLYIADALAFRDYLYELDERTGDRQGSVSPDIRSKGQKFIREQVEAINRLYHFVPAK